MPPKKDRVYWSIQDETALLNYLLEHKTEAGDGRNSKEPVFEGARAALQSAREADAKEAPKTLSSCKAKWSRLKATYELILKLKGLSGWSWDDRTGCSITADSQDVWEAFVVKNPDAAKFKNQGWVHLVLMSQILPDAVPKGHDVFRPSDRSIGASGGSQVTSQEQSLPPNGHHSPFWNIEDDNVELPDEVCVKVYFRYLNSSMRMKFGRWISKVDRYTAK
ncbi:hypothetical protein EST38_g12677 [Candolleomyces aberdarensis]|uniref:Myb/SANT-like domain-containing protein n=1 Tax=Candolleomyces aberdarensis TaxID=2316362 RepID=A0A4Q2D1T4_9AGAR|nr:hypothetical protein EST38_g12677 [Candolleomyces aberdarensis]